MINGAPSSRCFRQARADQARRGRLGRGNREVLEGILWVLRTGARWRDLLLECPPYQTRHRRLSQWVKSGTLECVLKAQVADMESRGGIDLSEAFIDAIFAGAKRGAVPFVQ